jgi:hypothetical protein
VCFGPAVQVLDLPDIAFGAQTTLAYDAENSADTGGTLSVTDGRHAAATRGKSTVKTALAGQPPSAVSPMRFPGVREPPTFPRFRLTHRRSTDRSQTFL